LSFSHIAGNQISTYVCIIKHIKQTQQKSKTMETKNATKVTVQSNVKAPVAKVWEYYNGPEHITKWNSPSPDWHCPSASSDLRPGGKFKSRMEAKDGSFGFDFEGIYDVVKTNELVEYTLGDGRKVQTQFIANGNETKVITIFDPENQNPVDFQQQGWQAILDCFVRYAEAN
jgi:uncharacterized protein YndB with AHSA1/START domain